MRASRGVCHWVVAWIGASLLVGACAEARGCAWYRDIFSNENLDRAESELKDSRGTVEVITGRFNRFPGLYHESRLERVVVELKSEPDNLELYDDAAVSADKLGDSTRAIELIEEKRKRLEFHVHDPGRLKEHWYRYYANLGTFQAHRWIRNGADRSDADDLRSAIVNLERGIAINPDAHFGREKYQVMALRWLLDPPMISGPDDLPNLAGLPVTGGSIESDASLREHHPEEVIRAMEGLTRYGEGWESVDVSIALYMGLRMKGDANLAHLARLRCIELLKGGKRSLHPGLQDREDLIRRLGEPTVDYLARWKLGGTYRDLRRESEDRNRLRNEYMLGRLRRGEHPDVTKEFWGGLREPAPPEIELTASLAEELPWMGGVVGLIVALMLIRVKRRSSRVARGSRYQTCRV